MHLVYTRVHCVLRLCNDNILFLFDLFVWLSDCVYTISVPYCLVVVVAVAVWCRPTNKSVFHIYAVYTVYVLGWYTFYVISYSTSSSSSSSSAKYSNSICALFACDVVWWAYIIFHSYSFRWVLTTCYQSSNRCPTIRRTIWWVVNKFIPKPKPNQANTNTRNKNKIIEVIYGLVDCVLYTKPKVF